MKLLILFMVVIGLCHAELNEELSFKRRPLKRVARHSIAGFGGDFQTQVEVLVIANCKANGHRDVEDELQESYAVLKMCIGKKTLFIDSKEDYITNLEKCAQDPIRKTKTCLNEDQEYFPQFLLDLTKSVVNFMYDDFDILRVNLPPCLKTFHELKVERKYLQCIYDSAHQTQRTMSIPSSKESYCQQFIPATRCFTDVIKEHCKHSPKMVKFREDFLNSMMVPCGLNVEVE